jgi:four helix bundle protein
LVILWSYFEKEPIEKQLVRAADSFSANLSEAHGRYSYPDRIRFAYFARRPLCETMNWIGKSIHRGLINTEQGDEILSDIQNLSLRINSCIKYLKIPYPLSIILLQRITESQHGPEPVRRVLVIKVIALRGQVVDLQPEREQFAVPVLDPQVGIHGQWQLRFGG